MFSRVRKMILPVGAVSDKIHGSHCVVKLD